MGNVNLDTHDVRNNLPFEIPGTDLAISNNNLMRLIEDIQRASQMFVMDGESQADIDRQLAAVYREIERRKTLGIM